MKMKVLLIWLLIIIFVFSSVALANISGEFQNIIEEKTGTFVLIKNNIGLIEAQNESSIEIQEIIGYKIESEKNLFTGIQINLKIFIDSYSEEGHIRNLKSFIPYYEIPQLISGIKYIINIGEKEKKQEYVDVFYKSKENFLIGLKQPKTTIYAKIKEMPGDNELIFKSKEDLYGLITILEKSYENINSLNF